MCAAAAAHHDVTLALKLQGSLKVGVLIRHGAIIGCLICDQAGACSPQDASAHGLCVLRSQLSQQVTVLVPLMLPAGKTPRGSVLVSTQLHVGLAAAVARSPPESFIGAHVAGPLLA